MLSVYFTDVEMEHKKVKKSFKLFFLFPLWDHIHTLTHSGSHGAVVLTGGPGDVYLYIGVGVYTT